MAPTLSEHDDNPWEEALRSFANEQRENNNEASTPLARRQLCWKRCVQTSLAWDFISATSVWIPYEDPWHLIPPVISLHPHAQFMLAMSFSSLFLIRITLAVGGMSANVCQRGSLLWSAYLFLLTATGFAALALYIGIEGIEIPSRLPIILCLIAVAIEILRFELYCHYRKILLQIDRQELSRISPELRSTPSPHSRPWWWHHDSSRLDDAREPLLHGPEWAQSHLPTYASPPPRRFFERFRQLLQPATEEERDIETSVQEWASKDEEDPHWWSRDPPEDANLHGTTRENHQPPSWIEANAHNMEDASTIASRGTHSEDS